MLFELDLANAIFLFCLVLGGGLLLVTVLLDDIVGGVLDALHLGFDIGGVTLMPPLLGFVAMFGVGGLIGTQVLQLDNGRASLLGAVQGLPASRSSSECSASCGARSRLQRSA